MGFKLLRSLSALVLAGLLGQAHAAALAAAPAAATIRIGINDSPQNAALEVAASKARAQGIDVELISFSDWNTPNLALNNGDLDLNYFQHQPFLENAIAQNGFKLVPIGVGVENKVGLYSKKITAFDQLKDGATVAVADDPVNQGRGLALYQRAGLITLREGAEPKASLQDITANPRHLKFIELPGPQLARVLDDVDLVQSYPSHLLAAGSYDPNKALLFSQDDANGHLYALRFVTTPDKANEPALQRFIAIFQNDPDVRDAIAKAYGSPNLYALGWLPTQKEAAR
ncbi:MULTISPECIES: MetQ/NlpA family ABC transporter substrate-binding protein [unclassified Pseudomonas]|uniref:MetQ/NlpA family ABC transporter substrate-binding protein n=1 Tax=unclassified Pseudomonas TaxID=196821 RepID=UPI000BD62D8F|nr:MULTISPECIES: MetQ/NlpA family ABC transporter substrate-binding protein [unclassified Pseudomonas]PVZ20653.1 D-methionine transport system substrate-binding protein [Pseudomonas sp. URIL14HWK12:I12]PVZ27719.1 D-methionine transport system substrate-binding protein [Pseudomonas sp. URIL14HWK12:I10]PVZ38608.1 D-methionine transport system substrate-binding protein [Pseudomonas sp. URIL14HWK12:I11]SNZ02678.1 D-methionine transport system substrate-binding protein [Pseudomonas sp. URIL14HWK12:I